MWTGERVGYFVLYLVLAVVIPVLTFCLLFLLFWGCVFVYVGVCTFIDYCQDRDRCSPVKFLRTTARKLRGCCPSPTENASGDSGSLGSGPCCSPTKCLRTATRKLGRCFSSSTVKHATTGVENPIPATSTEDIWGGRRPPSPPNDDPMDVPAARPTRASESVGTVPLATFSTTRQAGVAAGSVPLPRCSRCKSTQTDLSDSTGHRMCPTPPPSYEDALSNVAKNVTGNMV